MRLIDADAFKKYCTDRLNSCIKDFRTAIYRKMAIDLTEDICKDVDEQPTIDAVPVVRCEDCKYYDFEYPQMKQPWGMCRRTIPTVARDNDDYCKYGERK